MTAVPPPTVERGDERANLAARVTQPRTSKAESKKAGIAAVAVAGAVNSSKATDPPGRRGRQFAEKENTNSLSRKRPDPQVSEAFP